MTRRRPRAIGTAAESALVAWLKTDGWPDADRIPLSGNRDRGDVVVCRSPLVVVECKAGATAEAASGNLIRDWLAQTGTERANAGAVLAALVVRRYRRPVRDWDVWMDAASWLHLLDHLPWESRDAPWPLRSSLADWSAMAKAWADL